MKSPPTLSAGFTLLELLVTVSIAAVVLGLAIPGFQDIIRNSRLTGAANDLLRSTNLARSEAIKRQGPVVLCASDNSSAATPACNDGAFTQWIVFADTNANWAFDTGEAVLERRGAVEQTVTVRNDADGIISYAASGFRTPPMAGGKTPTTRVVICDVRGNRQVGTTDSAARALLIDTPGRARVTKTFTEVTSAIDTAGACP